MVILDYELLFLPSGSGSFNRCEQMRHDLALLFGKLLVEEALLSELVVE